MRFFFNPLTGQVNAGPPREIVYADTAPQYPLEGSRWFDTINLREYVYDGAAWVETGVGPAGVKGDTGEKGDKGDIGPIGPVGPQGPAATIAVGTVTTGSAGTSASVSNSGTSGAAVFDFTIPQGAKGDTGDIGPQGPQGIQGVKGDDGASISLKGAVTSPADLTSIAVKVEGDLYVAQNDGNGYVWDGSAWVNVGQIRGPKGDTGPQGPAGPAPAGTGAVVVSNGVVGTPVGYGTANVANTLVQRDASGNFSAGTITGTFSGNVTGGVTGNVTGNASTASKLATAQTINVSGDVTGTAQNFDGSAGITIPTAIAPGVIVNADINNAAAISDVKLATISTANKVSNSATTATSANTASAIVARDANGNFAAGTITAALSGNATSASSAAKLTTARTINGTSFDGSADITITAAPTAHNHDASNITAGTLANARLPARLQVAAQTITDWDNALENGWYQGNQAANAPEGVLDWWLGYVEAHYDRWVTQTVHRFTADAPTNTHIWRRSSADSGATVRTWGAWYKLQLSQGEQDARYALTAHTHDDRYYTETEVNTLLAGKQAAGNYALTAHTHFASDITTGTFAIGRIPTGTNSTTVALGNHTHDDRYFTEIEMGTLLSGKANSVHTHNTATTTTAGFMSAADKATLDGVAGSGTPTGAVMPFAMNSVPTGWLAANGTAVSRTTYAALFAAIGTLYGAGDASTTFNLPDLRGYFVRGAGTNSDGTVSGTFGEKQADALKTHSHNTNPTLDFFGGRAANGQWNEQQMPRNVSGGVSSTGPSTGVSTETRPKNIAMLYCIKF